MRCIRMLTLGAAVVAVPLGAALAQTANPAPDQPLSLLQVVAPKSKIKSHPAAVRERRHVKRRVARRKPAPTRHLVASAQRHAPKPEPAHERDSGALGATTATAPVRADSIWPTPDAAKPGVVGMLAPPATQPPVVSVPVVRTDPNDIVAGGHNLAVSGANPANLVDFAGENPGTPANAGSQPGSPASQPPGGITGTTPTSLEPMKEAQPAGTPVPGTAAAPTPSTPPTPLAPTGPAATPVGEGAHEPPPAAPSPPPTQVAQAGPEHAMVMSADPQPQIPVGGAVWIEHVLAALGGALSAGVVAWFLMRTPRPRISE